jgi:hypothetical protein
MQGTRLDWQPMTFWRFARHQMQWRVVIGVVLFLLFVVALAYRLPLPDWWSWLEPLMSLFTLIFAFFIWLGQLRRAWEEYLPNRLTVHFYCNEREVMRCEKAFLANESDIRALGQQIGRQMAKNEELRFIAPQVEISPPETNEQELYIHYTAHFYLSELPKTLQEQPLQEDEVLVWRPPFSNGPQRERRKNAAH